MHNLLILVQYTYHISGLAYLNAILLLFSVLISVVSRYNCLDMVATLIKIMHHEKNFDAETFSVLLTLSVQHHKLCSSGHRFAFFQFHLILKWQ